MAIRKTPPWVCKVFTASGADFAVQVIKQVSIEPLPQKSRITRLGVMHILPTSRLSPVFIDVQGGAAALAVSLASSDGPTTQEELISTSARTVNFP
jgi:hypothetical protein